MTYNLKEIAKDLNIGERTLTSRIRQNYKWKDEDEQLLVAKYNDKYIITNIIKSYNTHVNDWNKGSYLKTKIARILHVSSTSVRRKFYEPKSFTTSEIEAVRESLTDDEYNLFNEWITHPEKMLKPTKVERKFTW